MEAAASSSSSTAAGGAGVATTSNTAVPPGLLLQRTVQAAIAPLFVEGEGAAAVEEGPVLRLLARVLEWPHIMEMTATQMLNTLFHLVDASMVQMQQRNIQRPGFPLTAEQIASHARHVRLFAVALSLTCWRRKHLCSSLLWAFGGSLLSQVSRCDWHDCFVCHTAAPPPQEHRTLLAQMIGAQLGTSCGEVPMPLEEHLADMEDGVWRQWADKVPLVEIETHQAASPDVVIPTGRVVLREELSHC